MSVRISSTQAVLHREQGISALISQSWNLIRMNLKDCCYIILWPALLFGLSSLLFSLPASFTFLTATPLYKLMLTLVAMLLGLIAWFTAVTCWAFSYCVLARYFYSAIVEARPYAIKECWAYIFKSWQPLVLTLFLCMLIAAVLIALDVIIVLVGVFVSTGMFAALGISNFSHKEGLALAVFIIAIILWGCFILVLLGLLIAIQCFLFSFPFIAIATRSTEDTSWWPAMRRSFRLIYSNLPKLCLFGLAFFFFSLVISLVLHTPAIIWVTLESLRLGLTNMDALPLHLQAGLELWTLLTSFVLLPLHCSAVTLIWYDCQVRKEGLDLKLWLQQVMQRYGLRSPQKGLAHE